MYNLTLKQESPPIERCAPARRIYLLLRGLVSAQVLAQVLVLVLILLLTTGCGFRLRTYNFTINVSSFALSGGDNMAVKQPLRNSLLQAGLSELSAVEAGLVVELLEQRDERRSVSTAEQARAAEYEMNYGVRYRILDGEQQQLLPPTWVERVRVYRIDRDNIVGSGEERTLLQRELVQDVVAQIIRSMDAVSRPAET